MDTLEQRRFWVKRRFELDESGVNVYYKDLKKTHELEVSYKDISGKRERLVEGDFSMYVIFRICLIVMTIGLLGVEVMNWLTYRDILIIFLVGAAALIAYYISRKDYIKIGLTNDTNLYFFKDRPSESEVNSFIESMLQKRDKFLRKNFLEFDKLVPYENQSHNLDLLRDYKVLDEQEYDNEKQRLKRLFNNKEVEQKEIGFK